MQDEKWTFYVNYICAWHFGSLDTVHIFLV